MPQAYYFHSKRNVFKKYLRCSKIVANFCLACMIAAMAIYSLVACTGTKSNAGQVLLFLLCSHIIVFLKTLTENSFIIVTILPLLWFVAMARLPFRAGVTGKTKWWIFYVFVCVWRVCLGGALYCVPWAVCILC